MSNKNKEARIETSEENQNQSSKPTSTEGKGRTGYTRNNYRGRRNYNNNKDRGSHTSNSDAPSEAKSNLCNSVIWYKSDVTLFNQSAHVQTFHTTGSALDVDDFNNTSYITVPAPIRSNGVSVYYIEPEIGFSESSGDPINRTMINLFNMLRGKYTSTVPFQANDLSCYFLAIGSVLCLINDIKRSLEWVNLYVKDSVVIPTVLLKSHGFDLLEESYAYANNIFRLNTEIQRIQSLAVPQGVFYFEKCAWMCKHTYFDDQAGTRGNTFYLTPASVFMWSSKVPTIEDGNVVASGLKRCVIRGNTSIEAEISLLQLLVSALVEDDNVRQISGWITSYAGKNVSYPLNYVEKVLSYPGFEEEVVNMIRCSRFMPQYSAKHNEPVIAQSVKAQSIIDIDTAHQLVINAQSPIKPGTAIWLKRDWLFNCTRPMTDDDVMTSSRLMAMPKELVGKPNTYKFASDTWAIVGGEYFYRTPTDDGAVVTIASMPINQYVSNSTAMSYWLYQQTFLDVKPIIVLTQPSSGTEAITNSALLFSNAFTFVAKSNNITNLHEVAILSEFDFATLRTIVEQKR